MASSGERLPEPPGRLSARVTGQVGLGGTYRSSEPSMLSAFHRDGTVAPRGYGAAGSASAWHAEGQGFESP
jgi:hypothetical protein